MYQICTSAVASALRLGWNSFALVFKLVSSCSSAFLAGTSHVLMGTIVELEQYSKLRLSRQFQTSLSLFSFYEKNLSLKILTSKKPTNGAKISEEKQQRQQFFAYKNF